MLHEFQMSAYIEFQRIAEYSSGMLKKLSLILAMIGKPKVLLLDEPFITLDLQAMDSLKDHLVTFQKTGCTVPLTAHLGSLPIATQIVDLSQYLRTC
ncbi:ATP-binding cassette domain-containing protein [Sphingobacterium zhuxiongii]|uniref:ATP-binding cassette domain-containing protein n=1 Tax=Sphingobacterium zhuxiongii TaxID=2662364 RepID=UPI0039647F58